jgi:hypothetical protein
MAFSFGAFSLLFGVSSLSGYTLEGPKWAPGSVVTFQMRLGNAAHALSDGNTSWNTAAAPAVNFWNAQVQRLHYTAVANQSAPIGDGDHLNTMFFASTYFGHTFGSSTLAITMYHFTTPDNLMTEADVVFNTHQTFDSYRGALRFGSNGVAIADIRRVLIHELGHALGLGHPDQAGQHVDAIMNATISNRETLSSDDIHGGQVLYGAPIASATPTPAPTATPSTTPSHVANISTRMNVGTGDNVLIGGFIVKGSASQVKTLILRALGPSLAKQGVNGAMQNPTLELHGPGGTIIATNDNWAASANVDEIISSGLAPSDARESAMVATVTPGSYTAIVRGAGNSTGVALIEVYEDDSTANRLVNVSTRGRVGTNDAVLIGGLIVQGSHSKKAVLRALGPSLSSLGVPGVLPNPYLELHNASGALIATNNDWGTSAQASQIAAAGLAPKNSLESALMVTVAPGNYTAVVRGANNLTGIGIVEAYDLDP